MTMPSPKPFILHIADEAIADLRERVARTRWPDEPPQEAWSTGTSLRYLQDLVRYWRDGFDWRAAEARLNAFAQFTIPLKGIDLHFIHAPGRRPDAMPLLLSHGWPGSVFEFLRLIPLLQEDFTELNSQVVDATGEITNMVVGGIKSALANTKWAFLQITVPSVIIGQGYSIAYARGLEFLNVIFENDDKEALLLEDRLIQVSISLLAL